MALGIQYLGDLEQRSSGNRHNWCVLVPPNFVHQKFISDLARYDPPDHDSKPETMIKNVARWLSLQPDFTPNAPTPRAILDAYPEFCRRLDQARVNALGEFAWPQIVANAEEVAAGLRVGQV